MTDMLVIAITIVKYIPIETKQINESQIQCYVQIWNARDSLSYQYPLLTQLIADIAC